ncbi:MAG TPA: hypothetical protein VD833_24515 [Vicinamibacterales bacterium]|nr:hypothetical protein [Vicinamibacterales bacterium]
MGLSALIFCLALGSALPQQGGGSSSTGAEPASKPEAPAPPVDAEEMGVSLDKIQRALSRPPAITVQPTTRERSDLPLFRMNIEERRLSIQEILGPDAFRGPAPYGGMTHQEFLDLVTPTDVKGFAPFSNAQAATVAVTAFALQWGLKTAIRALQDAKDEREREAARREVQEALEALRKARREAGLPER